jgi:hypothetical protein
VFLLVELKNFLKRKNEERKETLENQPKGRRNLERFLKKWKNSVL